MFLLFVLIGFVLSLVIVIINRIVTKNNKNIKRFKLSRYLLFLNIVIFLLLLLGAPITADVIVVSLIILLLLNIIVIFMVYNKKIINNKKLVVGIMMVYFLFMFMIPIYKFENHEHIFIKQHEQIRNYTDYYNCYLIKILKINE